MSAQQNDSIQELLTKHQLDKRTMSTFAGGYTMLYTTKSGMVSIRYSDKDCSIREIRLHGNCSGGGYFVFAHEVPHDDRIVLDSCLCPCE